MNNRFSFRLHGGLGNQLFIYYSAMYLYQFGKIRPTINLNYIDSTHFEGGSPLLHFKLSPEIKIESAPFPSFVYRSRTFQKILYKIDTLRIFREQVIFPTGLDSRQEFNKFISNIPRLKKRQFIISGNFADFSYFDSLQVQLSVLELVQPTERFRKLETKMQDSHTTAIHHRLGDYLTLAEKIGVLSRDYYTLALESAKKMGTDRILIFSNDTNKSRRIFQEWGLVKPNMVWVGSETLPSPAETLKLMSSANLIICSNSTFSFWAAKFSNPSLTHVLYPSDYHYGGDVGIFGIPSHWKPIKSYWMKLEEE